MKKMKVNFLKKKFDNEINAKTYIIAYDPLFFGDLQNFFITQDTGYNTVVKRVDTSEFYDMFCQTESDRMTLKNIIKEKRQQGKKVIWLNLDNDHISIMTLLLVINQSNSTKYLDIIFS